MGCAKGCGRCAEKQKFSGKVEKAYPATIVAG
jgi:hypothetical protein